jgi:hypothetical protein
MKRIFTTACAAAIALTATLPTPAFSQSPLGTLLNGLTRKARSARDPFADMRVQTFKMEFALREGQMVFIGAVPGEILNQTRQSCIAGLTDNSGDIGSFSNDLSTPQPILKNGTYQSNERIMRSGNEYRLFTSGCGPVSTAPGSAIDGSNEAQFNSVGITTATLAADANNYIKQLRQETAATAARKQVESQQQAKLDKLWLHASARYLANGEMYTLGTDQYSPFQSAEECRTVVAKMLKAAIFEQMGRATLSGESVMAFADASGWVWVGCVSVKDFNSGAFGNYMDRRMTPARAKELKLVLNIGH